MSIDECGGDAAVARLGNDREDEFESDEHSK